MGAINIKSLSCISKIYISDTGNQNTKRQENKVWKAAEGGQVKLQEAGRINSIKKGTTGDTSEILPSPQVLFSCQTGKIQLPLSGS